MPSPTDLLSVQEAASLAGVTPQAIRAAAQKTHPLISSQLVGDRFVFERQAVVAYRDRRRAAARKILQGK